MVKKKKYYVFPDEFEQMVKDAQKDMEKRGVKRNSKWLRKI